MPVTKTMPAIIIRDVVVVPGMTVNFSVIKKEAAKACEEAMHAEQLVFVAYQREGVKLLNKDVLYPIGMIAAIKQINKLPDRTMQLVLDVKSRAKMVDVLDDSFTQFKVKEIVENGDDLDRFEKEACLRNLRELYLEYSLLNPKVPKVFDVLPRTVDDLDTVMNRVVNHAVLPYEVKIGIIQIVDARERFEKLLKVLTDEVEVSRIRANILKTTQDKVSKNQREYFLREQLNSIKKELGEDAVSEEAQFMEELEKLEASDEVKEKIKKEINRLSSLNSAGSEASVERGYIETLLELPWDKMSEDNTDVKHAAEVLDRDHYGLEKVKERILEFLSVRALNSRGDSPIICLVGPPGTGKTSIARSIADALGKKYVRLSLGGVRDEAEIRGHRRTYVGAMPGNIVAGLKQAGVKNPLMLLDEIDKTSADHKGDVASALLEVLDSEQNSKFRDHFVGIPIDLSEVLFIATANSASDIPGPLYDRMEIIEVSSYTANEKFHIAKEFLLKKQYEKNGLKTSQISINDAALKRIIEAYTKEAGVRELERKIGEICRKAAREILEKGTKKVTVTTKNLETFLGKEKYRADLKNKKDEVGIVRGLAWTPVGGTTLSVEVNIMPGKGEMELTGQMGDVMKESALAGLSFIRSIAPKYKIAQTFFEQHDIHIHIPEGAVPKDGPSAGITMATAVMSAITGIPVSRNLAMTGEITLRGRVLAVGGLKEKILAAKTAGIKKVLVPLENKADIEEISDEIKEGMDLIYVSSMKEVLEIALW
ncbi:MAG: endopeptidase La [Lachnospiraceae bacterium]|nr:endopeptidase La [Lachnospiraceae bacterium]MBR5993761.1 endopeptidase La [Lachnospiraceae bacterium]